VSPSSFGKREREQAKKAKADAKRARRQQSADVPSDIELGPGIGGAVGRPSTEELLEMIATLHEQYDAGTVGFEEFEANKADLLGRLAVD
jgi:hypothetical protein